MKKTIKDFELKDKKVLIRVDFNVPMKDGKITDDSRITKSLPTIQYAKEHGAKIILLSHLGRVKEEKDLEKNNLRPVAIHLANLLNETIYFSNETRGIELEKKVDSLKEGEILLVQNTRYEDLNGKKESSNDQELAKYWATLADIFINDAFGTLHRAHASNVGISSILPSGIGMLVEKELTHLESLQSPEKPFVVILGGSKVSDKIGVIESLVKKADKLLIGGAMAFTFLKAKGINTASSLIDEENIEFCKKILSEYKEKIILPIDGNVSTKLDEETENRYTTFEEMKQEEACFDIGEKTILLFKKELEKAETIFWNGPLGAYEFSKYQKGTKEILQYLTETKKTTILGGGDIASAAANLGYEEKITYISTGGGATLEYLEGKTLPGISAIEEKKL